MKTITLDGIMALRPCLRYTRERIEKLLAGRESITVVDILDMLAPPEDRLWLILHEELLPVKLLQELACDFAQTALGVAATKANRATREASWAATMGIEKPAENPAQAAWLAARKAAWAARAAAKESAGAAWAAAWVAQVQHVRMAIEKAKKEGA